MPQPNAILHAMVKDQARALGRLHAKTSDLPTAIPSASIEAGLVQSMTTIFPHLSPGPKLFHRVLLSGSVPALEGLLVTHGASVYSEFFKAGRMSLSETIKRGHWKLLAVLHAAGFDLSTHHGRMLKHAYRLEDPDYARFVRETLGDTRSLLSTLPGSAITEPVPRVFVEEIAQDLRAAFDNPSAQPVAELLRLVLPMRISPKLFALQLMSGQDLTITNRRYLDSLAPPVSDLVRKTASRHGRLELTAREPCLVSVLQRNTEDTFFGLSAKAYKAAVTLT